METITVSHDDCEYRFTGEHDDTSFEVYHVYERDAEGECWLVNDEEITHAVWERFTDELWGEKLNDPNTFYEINTWLIQDTPMIVACDGCDWSCESYISSHRHLDGYSQTTRRCFQCGGDVTVEMAEDN
jgi:hypothetical protein